MLAVAVVAASLACRPQPALGRIALVRSGTVEVVDLRACRRGTSGGAGPGRLRFTASGRARIVPFTAPLASADGGWTASVRAPGRGDALRNAIWVRNTTTGEAHQALSLRARGRVIRNLRSPGPIELLGWSGDDRWVFFAVDPGGSGSIAADGLILQVVAASGGAPHRLGVMLPYRDYLTWCGRKLVFSAGADRVATHAKRLLVADPPAWRPRELVHAPGRAWGSLVCRPGSPSLVVQSQADSSDAGFFATRWALWSVGIRGRTRRQLTQPPAGSADESPRFSRDGMRVMFVRSRRGRGELYALRAGHAAPIGPLLPTGSLPGYYGHRDWWQRMDWSLGRPL